MNRQIVQVTLEVEIEKPIDELAAKIAARAYTIQGVSDCNVVEYIGDPEKGVTTNTHVSNPSLWKRFSNWFHR